MKTRSPYNRDDLHIRKDDKVIEIGSGHNPTYRANVIVEKYIDNNYHRGGNIKIYPHQQFINADGEHLPIKDKEFDYVICNQVLEHVEHPEIFVHEQNRIAKRGYIETPSLIGEQLFPKKSHKWLILDIDGKLVMYEKSRMEENYANDYGRLFLNYLPYQSIAYRLLELTEGDLMINRYEWKDAIEIIVNPTEEKYLRFFTQPWDDEMIQTIFPPRSLSTEGKRLIKALCFLLKGKVKKAQIGRRKLLTLNEYLEIHHETYADLKKGI